jgi:hypothetical protein
MGARPQTTRAQPDDFLEDRYGRAEPILTTGGEAGSALSDDWEGGAQ